MPLLTWQLWLARVACIDSPLPWQSNQDTLSPGRVAQAFPLILAAIGTPAQPPKLAVNHQAAPKGISHLYVPVIPLLKNTRLKNLKPKNHLRRLI